MSERKGWLVFAVGAGLFLVAWLGFALAMYLLSSSVTDRILS
jgi:hypothetical protein